MEILINVVEVLAAQTREFTSRDGKLVKYIAQQIVGRAKNGTTVIVNPKLLVMQDEWKVQLGQNLIIDFSKGSYEFDQQNYCIKLSGRLTFKIDGQVK